LSESLGKIFIENTQPFRSKLNAMLQRPALQVWWGLVYLDETFPNFHPRLLGTT
jgi:hypothetical protein